MTSTIDQDVERLRERLTGRVILPADDGYDDARSVFNGEIDRRPAVITHCASPADVAAAIRFARDNDLELAVRGGAHNYGGAAVCDGGLMIHLGGLNQVSVDPAARTARCGGGATLAELDAATQEYGLAVPAGTISHTGVGGLTLGGGFGWLSRAYGLTIDNLRSAEVVTASGEVLHASAEQHPDLFWALRGGGGNFGVVTEFEFQLHPVGPIVQVALLFWHLEQGEDVLRLARELHPGLPKSLFMLTAAVNAPPAPFVPEQYHGLPGYAVLLPSCGDPAEHAAVVDQVRTALPPVFDFASPIPYTGLQSMLDEAAPWGVLAYQKALNMSTLPDGAIRVIAEHVPRKQSPISIMPCFWLGGAVSEIPDEATAYGVSRDTAVVVNIDGVATEPEPFQADRRWVRELWSDLAPYAENTGGYVNFLNDYQDVDRVRTAYGAEKYDRLARIKAAYDPDNVFHRNPNVKPASTAGQFPEGRP